MQKIINAVEKHKNLILEAERQIWSTPETGFKEYKTNKYLVNEFKKLGYDIIENDDITGFYTVIDTGREGPELLILGELDSIICPAHKDADAITGAVHSCGHNAQSATVLGIAAALKEEGMLDGLSGKIRLCLVPAEELLEIESREKLKKEGKINYFGGKVEYLYRGYFDGVDLAFMVHTTAGENFAVSGGSVGCIAKRIIYKGVAAHAGGSPWAGKNALYAATCGLNAVNAIRETFKEQDLIRVHPIITSGGDMVNAIPETVTLESYVRGSTFDAIFDTNKKVNQAFTGAGLSIGVNVEIIDIPGYAPLINDKGMVEVAKTAFESMFEGETFEVGEKMGTGSTDMGDLSCIMPVVHPYAPGAKGKGHGNDYEIASPETACVKNAKWQLNMINILLSNNALRAKKIVSEFKPLFSSKEEYFKYVERFSCSGNRITFNEDGTATVKID